MPDVVLKRLDKLEVGVGAVERLDREVRARDDQLQRLRTNLEDTVKKSEEKLIKNTENSINLLGQELTKHTNTNNNFKASLDDVTRKIDRIREYNIPYILKHGFNSL